MASSLWSPWKATMSYHCVTEQRFILKEQKEEGKEKIQSLFFSEWRVLEVRLGFHIETMACVHPAALALLLSLPILRLSICLWAQTRSTSCSTQHISQKFTSCASALLLHPNPIPRTCINSPFICSNSFGTHKQTSKSFPFLQIYNLPPLSVCHTR